MDELSVKVLDKFRGKVVRKDLTSKMKRMVNVPSYVLEYLLGSYCSTDNEQVIDKGLEKISTILTNNYVKKEEVEKIKFLIKEKKTYTIIDKITGYVDEYADTYLGTFSNFNIGKFVLKESFAKQYPQLFTTGMWCSIKINYVSDSAEDFNNEKKSKNTRFKINRSYEIAGLRPIQIPNIDIEKLIETRKDFTTDEWISLILRSAGIESSLLNSKEKMHFLERIVPLFERNYNLVELGPRGTGKSHVYKEISPHSILISGGAASISSLFYNLNSHRVGLVGGCDCIAFDEVSGMKFNNPVGIEILKDYMASGSFTRGDNNIYSDASMVFIGNINDSVPNLLKNSHLFSPFSKEMSGDSALFDRMHYYLPGWEVPKIKSIFLTEEFGFISDYFAEFAREMRKSDFTHKFDSYFKFNNQVNVRDEIGIRKTFSGLAKIIFPNGEMTIDDMELLLTYAIEGRRRVKEQLRVISGDEFQDVELGYIRIDGKEVKVNVPEKSQSTIISSDTLKPGHVYCVGTSYSLETPAVYKIESTVIAGSGKIEVQSFLGGGKKVAEDTLNAGWKQFILNASKVKDIPNIFCRDYFVYVNDIQNKGACVELSIAEIISLFSSSLKKSIKPYMLVIGDVSISGTIKNIVGVDDYIRYAINAGAKSILLPYKVKDEVFTTDSSLEDKIDLIYYSNVLDAVTLALDLGEVHE